MNPILLDFPEQFETERLLIRCPRPGDGAVIHEAIVESLDSLKRWLPFAHQTQTVESAEASVRQAYAKFILREDLRFLLFERNSNILIGSSGLHRMDWYCGRFEIGYWLRDCAVHKGYATEAVQGIVQFADKYLHARRIEIRCDSQNKRSLLVAKRCGFHLEATLKNDKLDTYNRLRDTLVFAKLKKSDGTLGYA